MRRLWSEREFVARVCGKRVVAVKRVVHGKENGMIVAELRNHADARRRRIDPADRAGALVIEFRADRRPG